MRNYMCNDLGYEIKISTIQAGFPSSDAALAAVAEERARIAAWADLASDERNMAIAVVRSSLRRLLVDPLWIPGAVRLGPSRLDIHVIVELDETQQGAAAAAAALEADVLRARMALAVLEEELTREMAKEEAANDGAPS